MEKKFLLCKQLVYLKTAYLFYSKITLMSMYSTRDVLFPEVFILFYLRICKEEKF